MIVRIALKTGHPCPGFKAGITHEAILPEGIVMHTAPHIYILLEEIALKELFASRTDNQITPVVIFERIIPEHDILHEIPAIFKVDAASRRGSAVPFKSVFLNNPPLSSAKSKPQSPVSDQRVMVEMNINRRTRTDDGPAERASCRSFDLGLIELQVNKPCAFRNGCILKLKA